MKRIVCSVSLFFLVLFSLCSCTKNVKMPVASTAYINCQYEEVERSLSSLGFTNVSVVPVEDISSKEKEYDKTVKSVSVNDINDFSVKDRFPIESKVVIEYHLLRMLNTPLKTDEINSYDYSTLETCFKNAGFSNVSSEQKLDFDGLAFDKTYQNEIKVNGKAVTSLESNYPYDTEIEIVGHYPFAVVPIDSDKISELQYQELIDMFIASGFKNTKPVVIDDLTSEFSEFEGIVSECSVDGETEYLKGEKYSNESVVTVTYHIVKMLATPLNYEAYNVRKYTDVEKTLKDIGFTNITPNEISDLASVGTIDGIVGSVSINGKTDYKANDIFPVDAEIIIEYHTVKKLHPPISSADIQNKGSEELKTMFLDCGFSNVDTTTIEDLDPDTEKSSTKNEIKIADSSSFSQDNLFAFDTPIFIILHKTYKKYTVNASFCCTANLFFSQYDLDIYIDGEKQLTVTHGNVKRTNLRLKSGEHTITATKAGTQSVKGETNIYITDDKEVSYNLSCHDTYVSIETEYDRIKGSVPVTTEPTTVPSRSTNQKTTEATTKKEEPTTKREVSTTKREEPTTKREVPTTKREVPTTKREVPTTKATYTCTYILNVNTKKFHIPGCGSIKKMNESNKREFTGTREEVIAQGFIPCAKCNP